MKEFIVEATARKAAIAAGDARRDKEEEYVAKSQRARNYDKWGAVSPLLNAGKMKNTGKTHYKLLRDVVGTFFPVGTKLEQRIKVVHSVRLIQRAYRQLLSQRKLAATLTLQAWFRARLATVSFTYCKFAKLRKVYFQAKLTHWYPVMVNRYREKRGKRIRKLDFTCFLTQIVTVQKHIRGYLVRKYQLFWFQTWKKHRISRKNRFFPRKKLEIWGKTVNFEEDLLKTARAVEEQIADSQIMVRQGRKVRGFDSEKEMAEYFGSLEQAEITGRRQKMWICTTLRIKVIVQ